MASCKINSSTIRNGITNLITKDLLKTGVFEQEGKNFIAKNSQYNESQSIVNDINDRFHERVIRKMANNTFSIELTDDLLKNYIVATEDGKEVMKLVGLYYDFNLSPNSWNKGEMFTYLNYPEISEMTNDKLKGFLTSLNPNFRVEEVDNLSVKGIADIKNFLIQVKTLSKFSAMPEEVAHVFIELLPEDNALKQEMLANITSLPIYSQTLAAYKNIYVTEQGHPDYTKIKREAAAKLVGEYVTALSTGNMDRVSVLGKARGNFLTRWFHNFLKWLGLGMRDHTQSYADIAGIILSGKNDQTLKTPKEIEDISFTDSYFYRATEEELFDHTEEILTHPPPKLAEVITNFSKAFGRYFSQILKQEAFKDLNDELKRDGVTIGKLNKLLEIKDNFSQADIGMKAAMDTETYIIGVKQFLEGVDRLETLSDAMIKIISNKEKSKDFDTAIANIKELQVYVGISETFKNMISKDLADTLIESNIGKEVVASILKTNSQFDHVNRLILNKLKDDLFIFYKEMLADTNTNVADSLQKNLDKAIELGDKKLIEQAKKKITDLVTNDSQILAMLGGRAKDIDHISNLNHLMNAAVSNGDVYVAALAKFIQTSIEKKQQTSKVEQRNLLAAIDPLQKKLGEPAHVTGGHIAFVNKAWDRVKKEEVDVLSWLNPHKNIEPAKQKLRLKEQELREKRNETDINSPEYAVANAAYMAARKEYSDFLNKYYNRAFVKEYYQFREKFEENPIFNQAFAEFNTMTAQINGLEEALKGEPGNQQYWDDLAIRRRERSNLLSTHDMFGKPKGEAELAKVNQLKQFFDESSKFKEIDEIQTERSYLIGEGRYLQKVDFAIEEARKARVGTIGEAEKMIQDILKDNRIRIANPYDLAGGDLDEIDYDLIKKLLSTRWKERNITIQKSEQFYADEAALWEKVKALTALDQSDEALKDTYEKVRYILLGSRDGIGEINPEALTKEQLEDLQDLEDMIEELRKSRPTAVDESVMSETDVQRLHDLDGVINDTNTKSSRKVAAIIQKKKLLAPYQNMGKNKELKELYDLIGQLTSKSATQYYWDRMEQMIPSISEFAMKKRGLLTSPDELLNVREFEQAIIDAIDDQDTESLDFDHFTHSYFEEYLDWIETEDPDVYNWFVESHKPTRRYDEVNRKVVEIPYYRRSVYIHKSPVLPQHSKIVYNRKYQRMRVKDEYRTGYNAATGKVELKVGEHITNRENDLGLPEYLPLLPEHGAPKDSPFRNEAYYKLKNSQDEKDKVRFEYMELLKQANLKHQELVPPRLRSWLDVPVMELSHLESKLPSHLKDVAQQKLKYLKTILPGKMGGKSETGEAEAQLEGVDTVQEIDRLTDAMITDHIPKLGMNQRLEIHNVSRDLLKSTLKMINKANEFTGRSEAQPVVAALIQVMKDSGVNNKERVAIFEKMYSQMILEERPDTSINNKQMRRFAQFLTSNTALRMVADPVGGVVNYLSAMVNNVVEATAGKYMSLQEFRKGSALAGRLVMSLMADFNNKGDLSLDTIMFQDFEFIQGEFEEDLLDRSSSLSKKTSINQLLMLPRKNGELHAQSATALGIMERHKVLNSIDGKKYPAHQIYEKHGNNMRLKAGFPESYNPQGGKDFLKLKQTINRVNLELHGNYAKLSQSEASRYALGKLAENMKRWFMPAFQRRFGRTGADVMFEDATEGYYRTAARAAWNYFTALLHLDFGHIKSQSSFLLSSPMHKQNIQRMGSEAAQAFLLFLALTVGLGYSGDDKNKALDNNNWLHNISILIALRTVSETTAYIPIPPFGFQELKRNVLTPFSLPADAISNMAAIAQLGMYQVLYWMGMDSFKDDLYYQKNSGFWYSEKGDSKLMKYVIRTAGYTGYTFEPAPFIKTFSNLQNRLK